MANMCPSCVAFFFFFNDTATTEIYTLSLHDALPIWCHAQGPGRPHCPGFQRRLGDRKSTRLNSSHSQISYAVFCLKKKKSSAMVSSAAGSDLTTTACASHVVRCCWTLLRLRCSRRQQ